MVDDAPWLKYQKKTPTQDAPPTSAPGRQPWLKYQKPVTSAAPIGSAPAQTPARPVPAAPPAPTPREEKQSRWYDSALGDAKAIGTGLERGVAAIPGTFGDIANVLGAVRRGIGVTGQAMGFDMMKPNPNVPNIGGHLPSTQNIMDYAQKQGLPVHTPTTTAERYLESIGSFVPMVALGPGGLTRKALQAAGGGIVGQVGQDVGGPVGGLVGGAAGLAAGSGLRNVGRAAENIAKGEYKEGAYNLLGRDPIGRPRVITHDEQVKDLADSLQRTTGGSTADMVGMDQRANKLAKTVNDLKIMEPARLGAPGEPSIPSKPMEPGRVQEVLYAYGEGDPQAVAQVERSPQLKQIWTEHFAPLKAEEKANAVKLAARGAPGAAEKISDNYMNRMALRDSKGRLIGLPARGPAEGVTAPGAQAGLPSLQSSRGATPGPRGLSISLPSQERTYSVAEKPIPVPAAAAANPDAYLRAQAMAGRPTTIRRLLAKSEDGTLRYVDNNREFSPDFNDEKVVPAYTREIEAQRPERFHKNAWAVTVENVSQQRAALRNYQTIEDIKESGWFKANSAKKGTPVPNGWTGVAHPDAWPQFQDLVMEPRIAHALDDFAGHSYAAWERGLGAANRFMQGAMFWSPVPHGANVWAHAVADRGWANFTPKGQWRAARALPKAVVDVWTQGPITMEFLRNGGAAIRSGLDNANFFERMLNKTGQMMERESRWFDPVMTAALKAYSATYGRAQKGLWNLNDMLLIQRYIELKEMGFSPREAIHEIGRGIPDYRIPDKVWNSRGISELLQNPAFGQFSRYHYNRLAIWGHHIKEVTGLGKEGTSVEQMRAAGQLFATAALATILWQAVDEPLRKWTHKQFAPGKDKIPQGREFSLVMPGQLATLDQAARIYRGEGDISSFAAGVFNLAPAVTAVIELWKNKDTFRGTGIRTHWIGQNVLMNTVHQTGNIVEHLARAGVQPYQTATGAWEDATTGATIPAKLAMALKASIATGLGARYGKDDRTKAAEFKKYSEQEFKRFEKKPRGPIESGVDDMLNVVAARIHKATTPPYGGAQ